MNETQDNLASQNGVETHYKAASQAGIGIHRTHVSHLTPGTQTDCVSYSASETHGMFASQTNPVWTPPPSPEAF